MTQSIFHHREHFIVVARLGMDQAIGRQASLIEARCKQVAAPDDPEHLAFLSCGNSSREQGSRGIVTPFGAGSGHFMQRIDA